MGDEQNKASLLVDSHLRVLQQVRPDPSQNSQDTGDELSGLVLLVERAHKDTLLLSQNDHVGQGSSQLIQELKVDLVLRLGVLGSDQLRLESSPNSLSEHWLNLEFFKSNTFSHGVFLDLA